MNPKTTYQQWIEAFTIFDKYVPAGQTYQEIAAEHDIVYAGPPPEGMEPADRARLEELGWHASEYEGWEHYV